MTAAQKLNAWPRIQADIRAGVGQVDAVLRINGKPTACAARSVEALRAGIIARATRIAAQLGRPVALDVDEAGQSYRLGVRGNGVVQPVDATQQLPDAAGLQPVDGSCRACAYVVDVTTTECPQCHTHEPLWVELSTPPAPRPPENLPTQQLDAAVVRTASTTGTATAVSVPPVDETIIVPRTARPRIIVHIESGETVTVNAPAVLGRNPQQLDGHSPVVVPSRTREVSRTHASVDVDDRGNLIVTDRQSANGVYADGRQLAPNTPTIVPAGTRLQLGDAAVRIEAQPERPAIAETPPADGVSNHLR